MKFYQLLAGLCLTSTLISAQQISQEARTAVASARELSGAVKNCDMSWVVDRMYPPIKQHYANKLALRTEEGKRINNQRMLGQISETAKEKQAREAANVRALRDIYIKQGNELKKHGVVIERFNVAEPFAEYIVSPPSNIIQGVLTDTNASRAADKLQEGKDKCRLVILPTLLILRIPSPDGTMIRMEQRSFIYAVRDESNSAKRQEMGIEANTWYFIDAKTGVKTLRECFTDLPARIPLPQTTERRLP